MASKGSRDFRTGSLTPWLVIGVVLSAAVAGAYFAASGQLGRGKTASPADAEQASPGTATPAALTDATLPVEGMSCGACAARIKRTLKGIDGVADVEVSLAERNVRVRYADGKVTPEHLAAAVNELGYKARVQAPGEPGQGEPHVATAAGAGTGELQEAAVTIPVEGMACEFCAQSMQERLAGIEGVRNVWISLERKEATVRYVEGKVTPQRLAEEIRAQGFEAGTPTGQRE